MIISQRSILKSAEKKFTAFLIFTAFFAFFSVIKIESCKTMIAEMILEVSIENIFHSLKVHFVTPVFHTCDLLYILIQPIWKKNRALPVDGKNCSDFPNTLTCESDVG